METQTIIQTAESSLLHTYNRFPIVLDHGEDVYLYDTDQKKYLDFAAGIAVFALGYSNDAYKTAVKEQVDKLATFFVLKEYKINGIVLDEEEKPSERLVVTP